MKRKTEFLGLGMTLIEVYYNYIPEERDCIGQVLQPKDLEVTRVVICRTGKDIAKGLADSTLEDLSRHLLLDKEPNG